MSGNPSVPEPSFAQGRLVLDAEALDFAPDLLAIQERPPSRMPRALAGTVALLVGLLLLWANYAELDIIASAEGRLVPQSRTKVVQPAEAGVVEEILVQEGSAVRQGQVLLRLDARASRSDLEALQRDSRMERLSLRRLGAELGDRALLRESDDPPQLFEQVHAQFVAHRQSFKDALAQEIETVNRARADLAAAQQVQEKLAATLPVYQRTAEAYEKLLREGFVGELASSEKTRDLVEKQQDLRAQASAIASMSAVIELSKQRLAGVRSGYHSQLEADRIEALGRLNRIDNELGKSNIKVGMLEIRAPNSGIVKDLATTTRGAVVAAGTLLMNIVPQDEPLQAEVLLRNEDAGFVSVGQPVRLKVAAFPFQKYGLLEGTVALVSADVTDAKQDYPGQQPALTYKAVVRLAKPTLDVPNERLALNAGMLVIAEIHQGRRAVVEYLLSPVRKLGQEAARER